MVLFIVVGTKSFVKANRLKKPGDNFKEPILRAYRDGRGSSSTPHERQEPNLECLEPSGERLAHEEERLEGERLEGGGERLGPLTRSMTKLRMGALGQATDGRESNMYMLHEGPLRVA